MNSNAKEADFQEGHEKGAPAVARALVILEALAASRKGLTLSQIVRAAKVPRSSAYYIMNTLEHSGYVFRSSPRARYTFTPKLFAMANRSVIGLGLREQALPFLRELAEHSQLTVHAAVISQDDVVLIEKVAPSGYPPLPTWVGKRLPIHCTGAGKALMSYMPQEQLEHHFRQGFIRYNDNTIVSPARMKLELERIRANGFAFDDEEETVGLRCIGAPLFDGGEQPVAAISIAGTIAEINDENLNDLARMVKNTAQAISARLVESGA
ncbi:MAG: IclR family transcriptional regulator [Bryobacteraceae bacterium]